MLGSRVYGYYRYSHLAPLDVVDDAVELEVVVDRSRGAVELQWHNVWCQGEGKIPAF